MASGSSTATNIVTLMKKFQTLLKKTKYIGEFNTDNIKIGKSEAYVPIYYHLFYKFSLTISERVSSQPKLLARNDAKFIQVLLRILKDVFDFVPQLTKEEFLQTGFAERKIKTCIEVMQLLYNIHINETNFTKQESSVTSRAHKSNIQISQRRSMQALTAPLLYMENKQWPIFKTDPIEEEPADHSTPKEGFTGAVGRESCRLLTNGSPQRLLNLGVEVAGLATRNENGILSSNLQADLDDLKRKVDGLTRRLDEIANYVYSPVNVLPVPRPRPDDNCDEQFR